MTTSNKTAVKPSVKPTARLDASLLLARKGEASPAVASTQHNNPGLAWGEPAHPGDFQPQSLIHAHPPVQPPQPYAGNPGATKPIVMARLRPDSFFAAHGRGAVSMNARTRPNQDRDAVALTLRVEDETYLRMKYLAQHTGRSTQQVLAEALDNHLVHSGVPHSRKLIVQSE